MSLMDQIIEKLSGTGATAVQGTPASSDEPLGPYEDLDALRSRVKEKMDQTDRLRWAFERLWFRSVLYHLGNQWLTWDARSRRWREKKLRKWVPRPVTNRYASTVSTIVSAILSTRVMPSVWPSTDDTDDIATADVADRLIPVFDDEINIHKVRQAAARWLVLNGDALLLPSYDRNDKTLGMTSIPSLRCDTCQVVGQPLEFESGVCPHCSQPSTFSAAMDESGQPIVEKYPVGRLRVDVFSPLEVYLNLDLTDIETHPGFTSMKTYALDTIVERWGEEGKKVKADGQSATRTAKYFIEALSYSTEDSGYNLTGAASRDRATVFTHFEMPSEKYPEGFLVVMSADEVVLEAGPSPYYEEVEGNKEYYWPLVKIPYDQVPGRLYGKSPAFDLLNKQDQLNRLESLIELATMRGTYGVWLLPTGSSISNLSGEPGLQVRWTPSGTGGNKPEIVTNAAIPAYILEWKTQIQQDFEELGGTFDAIKGNVPRGVSAGYAIQLLTERSYGRFASVFENWEAGWVQTYKILLKLFRTYATEDRLRRIKGDTGNWEISKFSKASLKGSVDIRVEGGASKPRSKLAEQALVDMMIKSGVINIQDPEQKYRVAEIFGMGHVLGAVDDDMRAAAKEWEDFKQWDGQPLDEQGQKLGPSVRIAVDNHVAHISDHRKRAMSDAFFQQPKPKQVAWEQHIMDHMNMAMAGMQQAPQPGKNGGPPKKDEPSKPPTSKANEKSDKTMDVMREGGSSTLGA